MKPSQKQYDVIIVGGGASGLTAAYQAALNQLKVLVIEKGHTLGGGGNYMEGAFAVNSTIQKAQGMQLDGQEILDQSLVYSHHLADYRSLKQFIAHSADNIQWLSDLGVKFSTLMYTMHLYEGGGKSVIAALKQHAVDQGVEIITSAQVSELLTDADHGVVGVKMHDLDSDEDDSLTSSATILATGGYLDNPEMVDEMTHYNSSQLLSVSSGKSTGDGLKLAWSVGARKFNQCIQFSGGQVKNTSKPIYENWRDQLNGAANQQGLLWVNELGDRFVNEVQVLDSFCESGNALTTQNRVFSVLDQGTIDHLMQTGLLRPMNTFFYDQPVLPDLQNELSEAIAKKVPYIHKADTVAELAQLTGLTHLPETIKRYNELAASGKDTDFGKEAKYLLPLAKAPYYVIEDGISAFCASGGLQVNLQNQVLTKNGQVIKGLYATGNDAAGVLEGETYNTNAPGTTSGYTIFSGRNAANVIAETLKQG